MPTINWDAEGEELAVNSGAEYVVEVYHAGAPFRTIRRPIAPAHADQETAEREAADWRFNGCLVPPSEVVKAAGYLALIPVVQGVALSPEGELWVLRRGAETARPVIDLFDSSANYLGTLPAGAPFPAAFLSQDRIVAVEKDSSDVPRVTVYAVDRSAVALQRQ